MKYIDAEKLIAEIKRRKEFEGWCAVGSDTADVYYARGFRFACDFVLNTITSLQQEQLEVDLEKEIVEMIAKQPFIIRAKDQIAFARHFYELGLNARKEDRV